MTTDPDKLIDFDAFRAEQGEVPIKFRIGGAEYDLPPALPASIAVDVIRMKQTMSDDEEVDVEDLMRFCEAVFGSELWREILDKHRISLAEIPKLLEMVLEAYTADPKAEEPSPTSETTKSSSGSSNRGRGSRRTSSASTEST